MTIRISHEGRGWSLYVNGKRRLYEATREQAEAIAKLRETWPMFGQDWR